MVLAGVFFTIWILIGIFVGTLLVQGTRRGAFAPLFSKQQPASDISAPTEATLPGIGKVNVACARSALSSENLQKVVQDQGTSGLSDQDKTKFEACITEKETATPSASPQQ